MGHLDFHFARHVTRVDAPDPVLAWLEEFFAPQFPAIHGAPPDRTIRFVVDAREHQSLLARGPHPQAHRVDCFTLDTRILSAALWQTPDDRRLAFDEAARVFYRHSPGAPGVVSATAAEDAGPARVALMRMVREFAMMDASRAGWLLVHGAAVQVGDGAMIVAGPKRAGKTTVLLHALLHEGGALVANDRVAIRLEEGHAFVHGIPTIVSLRAESADWFPALALRLADGRYDFRRLLRERQAPATHAPVDRPAQWSLSPRQLCHLLDVESRATAGVSAVLFPTITGQPGAAVLEALPADRAIAAWTTATFRPFPAAGMFRMDEASDPSATERRRSLTAQLVSGVPSFDCHLGTDAYGESDRWLGRAARGQALGSHR